MADKSKRIDWHRIGFWGTLAGVATLVFIASFHKDRRVITVFEAEGRNELSKYVRYNFPTTAEWMGLNHAQTAKPGAPTMSSR